MGYRFSHFALGAAALAPFAGWSTDAGAQTYTVVSITPGGAAGTFVSSSVSDVTLTLSPSGSFTPTGNQRSATAPTYTVTVKCVDGSGNPRRCSVNSMVAVLQDHVATAAGRLGPLQDFTIGAASQSVSAPSGSNPTTFTLGALTNSATATFRVGFGVPVLQSGTTGTSVTRTFSVGVGLSTSSITSTMNATMAAIVWNPMAIGVTGALDFGKVVKPASGAGAFTLSPGGSLSASGGGVIMPGNSHGVPSFTVTGEGAQAFSLTVPGSFLMSGGANTLTVTTTTSFSGTSQTLSGAVSSQGSFPFTVGGVLPVSSTTPSGAYTGNLIVGVQYN